ncbi:NUDIX hydrolase [Hazenella sp. IB182353]|uniref:NUDIX hydrolase n=1 Tax=Polycladospora coralii TaxID=2771432 RepID=UPI00174712E9|nr:NUDIX hydrolase [Polycladospora coralii]MBS7530163.1 NUDIX hydrolase [Polycladospora coralii]
MKALLHTETYQIYTNEEDDIVIQDNFPESAVVFAIYEGKLAVVKQFRSGIGTATVELPGCGVEENETEIEAAKRELLEETGLIAGHIQYLGRSIPQPYFSNHVCHLFFATISDRTTKSEEMEVVLVPLEQVEDHIRTGKWQHSELVHAYSLAKLNGLL